MAMDPVAARNYSALKSKSYAVKFELSGTPYDSIENIGSGTYGVVCSAINRITKARVAIKKISSIYEQPVIAKRTYREIKILTHFKHDNVIAIRDIFRPKGPIDEFKDVYIVFDLMESDLHRIIHSHQELSNDHVRYFLYQILRGLKYVHSANVLHRDLKPSNLFVNENCELKLGDFGMARGVSSQQDNYHYNMTQYVATRWYRAPELMLLPLEYSSAVDVWSVGCILAEMLSGKHLFKGANMLDQLKLIVNVLGTPSDEFFQFAPSNFFMKNIIKGWGPKEAVPLERLLPHATPMARDLLARMLVIDPHHRISVVDALQHPYLSRYHDPNDEPVCVPAFDFQFEKEKLTGSQLKEVILKEIREFEVKVTRRPVFDLRPVQKAAASSPPATTMSGPSATTTSGPVAPRTSGPLASRASGPPATGLQAFLLQQQQGAAPRPPAAPPAGIRPVLLDAPKSDVADIEMLSGKLLEMGLEEADGVEGGKGGKGKAAGALSVTAPGDATLVLDVDMLSAKCTSAVKEEGEGEGEGKTCSRTVETVEKAEQPASVDSKALIKEILRARQQQADGAENKDSNPLVTAAQRQREREDRRRKMMKKRRQKKAKEEPVNAEGPRLTDEDRNMLARWRSMQQQPAAVDGRTTVSTRAHMTSTHSDMTSTHSDMTSSTARESSRTANTPVRSLTAEVVGRFASPPKRGEVTVWAADRGPVELTPRAAWPPTYSEAMEARQGAAAGVTQGYDGGDGTALGRPTLRYCPPLGGADDPTAFYMRQERAPQQGRPLHATQPPQPPRASGGGVPDARTATDLSAFARHVAKSNADEMTLEQTPRGSADSCGIGLDLDALLRGNGSETQGTPRLDSAPLSASLLADWLEVSGNVDINAEALLDMSPTVIPNLII